MNVEHPSSVFGVCRLSEIQTISPTPFAHTSHIRMIKLKKISRNFKIFNPIKSLPRYYPRIASLYKGLYDYVEFDCRYGRVSPSCLNVRQQLRASFLSNSLFIILRA